MMVEKNNVNEVSVIIHRLITVFDNMSDRELLYFIANPEYYITNEKISEYLEKYNHHVPEKYKCHIQKKTLMEINDIANINSNIFLVIFKNIHYYSEFQHIYEWNIYQILRTNHYRISKIRDGFYDILHGICWPQSEKHIGLFAYDSV